MLKLLIITLFSLINLTLGGVLILSPKPTDISSLKTFDYELFDYIKSTFKKSKIISFKINSDKLPSTCEHLTDTKYSSYIPTIEYIPDETVELNGGEQSCLDLKKQIRLLELDGQKNVVYLIIHYTKRLKRSISTTTAPSSTITSISSSPPSTTTEEAIVVREKPGIKEKISISPLQPVLYSAGGKAMIYSSWAPQLKISNESTFVLGPAAIVTIDERENYTRMICTIPVDSGKIVLRFRFPWDLDYWSLASVEAEVEARAYNLTITSAVSAPEMFSHRCGGETIFTDGSVTLTLYEMQVQPKSEDNRFSDAYNCVPFMTAPIWSGIFVSSILCVGLFIGFGALGSIKTMDKFDNSKTRQLTITIMGE